MGEGEERRIRVAMTGWEGEGAEEAHGEEGGGEWWHFVGRFPRGRGGFCYSAPGRN